MKLEFKAVVSQHCEDWVDKIELQRIPTIGDGMGLTDDFNVLENEPPIDKRLVNLARNAFFENKCLKITIEWEK